VSLGFVAIGVVAGVLAGLFGIGGGIVIVPALVLTAGMTIQTATGTSLGALLLPVGLFGALVFYRSGHLDVRAALLLALGLSAGAYLGAILNQSLRPAVLSRLFAILLVAVAIRLWVKA
jgi:uncharacterized membrane protein YfcA